MSLHSGDHHEVKSAPWSKGLQDGPQLLRIHSEDRLGNQNDQPIATVWLDQTPPTLSWRRMQPSPGIDDDLYNGRPIWIELKVKDEAAGVQSLQVNGQTIELNPESAPPTRIQSSQLRIEQAEQRLPWRAIDRVGNIATGAIELRIDRQGPTLAILIQGRRMNIEQARLMADQGVTLVAEDEPAGVAEACVKASIWRGARRPLPLDLVGLSPGRYALTLFARDRLGNKTRRRFDIEVSP